MLRTVLIVRLLFVVGALSAQEPEALSAELKAPTVQGFERYVKAAEARVDAELKRPNAFLYLEGLPEPRRSQALATIKNGEIYMARMRTLDASGHEITTPDGLIHHWYGAVFISGASLPDVIDLVEDYDHHQDIYRPEVVRSRLVSRNGDDFKIFYRLRKKKVITVTLNTDHDVHYSSVDSTHCHSRSYTTRIAEVENADAPNEREKPVGHGLGTLWRMNSYWRFEERDGGVYVESESISLTRDIPTGFGWIIKPFTTGIPRESLLMTMGSTRSAVLARIAARSRGK